MPAPPIPYHAIETVFLDVGNTLVAMDYLWIRDELAARGIRCSLEELRRAEAASRPAVSERLALGEKHLALDLFGFYLRRTLEGLEATDGADPDALVRELLPILRAPGRTQRLWSYVLPGVREALGDLRAAGLRLVVVSNSDGSVEQGLVEQELRPCFDAVIDSHVVGFEKPDPRIFEKALEVSGADRGRTVHAGDLYAADVVGARAADLHAVLVDPFGDWAGVDCERLPDVAALASRILASRP